MIFLLGGADCWGSEWRDSHLGPENGPQRTADSRARSLGELCPHRPRCQLHGSRQQLGASPNWTWDAKTGVGEKLEWGSCFYPPNREIVTCGTWLEGWETKWRSSFQRRRSRRTNDTRCAASSAPTPREAFCCFCLTWCQTEKKNLIYVSPWMSPDYWPPAQRIRPARSGGRPTSPWWRSWASKATTPGRRPEAGCGTAPSPETRSTSLQVRTFTFGSVPLSRWAFKVKNGMF